MKNGPSGWRMGLKVTLVATVAMMLYTFSDHNQVPQDILSLWETEAQQIPWLKPWKKVLEWQEPLAHWFVDGQLNASHACLDSNIQKGLGAHKAIIWESEQGEQKTLTYAELYDEVNRCADVLQKLGVKQGDRVIIYMPMIPEAVIAMLAIVRLGATHSVVFSGFSAHALKDRIDDMQAEYVITADYGLRRGKKLPLKAIVDEAVNDLGFVKKILVFQRGSETPVMHERDVLYQSVRSENPVVVAPVPVESNHPLFVLYTSGTTGKPKGIVHSTGGYLTYAYSTFKWAFGPQPDDVYWCTADIGWITGHSYVVYAPLMHGITVFINESAPDWPDFGIWWRLIEKYKINIFYTSPTALRMAMKAGESWPEKYNITSLRVLGSVGEPINPDVWLWYHKYIGGDRCPIIDTWWQTETGGFMIAPAAGLKLVPLKPGSATKPLPGIFASVVDQQGKPVQADTTGYLVISQPWPGMSIGIYNEPERFKQVYWSTFKGAYYTGDYARQDKDGYFWLLGRADEVLKIAAHRIGTAEVEHAALTHHAVAEAAAVGVADEIRGEQLVLFVTLKADKQQTDALTKEIIVAVRSSIGAFVTPQAVYYVNKLPKTRSGKIMRRLLKAVLEGRQLSDISTLEDEASLDEIRAQYVALQQSLKAKDEL